MIQCVGYVSRSDMVSLPSRRSLSLCIIPQFCMLLGSLRTGGFETVSGCIVARQCTYSVGCTVYRHAIGRSYTIVVSEPVIRGHCNLSLVIRLSNIGSGWVIDASYNCIEMAELYVQDFEKVH